MRQPISAEEKLAVTLRFLATGKSYSSLSFLFRMHETTISRFVPIVCCFICQVLKPEHCVLPRSENDWVNLADETFARWQYPNGVAAADGKHVAIKKPIGSGSEYFNYKKFFSIVLMALVTYDYKFLYFDAGCQGRISVGGVGQILHLIRSLNRVK